MSVQAIRITTYAPATVGSISRIKLVSQAVTGPTGPTGAAFDPSDGDAVLALRWFL